MADILRLDDAQEILDARARQDPEGDLRAHAGDLEQSPEQAPLALRSEAEQDVRVLAHHQMREQRHGLPRRAGSP